MVKITLGILGEKIDNLQSSIDEIKVDTKQNTEFRLQFKGALMTMIMLTTVISGSVGWLLNKFMR